MLQAAPKQKHSYGETERNEMRFIDRRVTGRNRTIFPESIWMGFTQYTFALAVVLYLICSWVGSASMLEQFPQYDRKKSKSLETNMEKEGKVYRNNNHAKLNDIPRVGMKETTHQDMRWTLLEGPLTGEIQLLLQARDQWWTEHLHERVQKIQHQHQQELSQLKTQIQHFETVLENQKMTPSSKATDLPAGIATNYQHQYSHALLPYQGKFLNGMNAIDPFVTPRERILQIQTDHGFPINNKPIIYFITPTIHRRTQMADLTRLGQTLLLDQRGGIYWILVEDGTYCTERLRYLLIRLGIPFAHVHVPSPTTQQKIAPRGVVQRNKGLEITRQIGLRGVIYFGDDDNAYDMRIFDNLRLTQRIGVLPVGYRGGGHYERCIVNAKTGSVDALVEKVPTKRMFPMDMAGLVYHTDLVWSAKPRFSTKWPNGQQETRFVQQLVQNVSELEPLAWNCSHFLTWHVQTAQPRHALRLENDRDYAALAHMV